MKNNKSADEVRLCAVADELDAVLKKHDVGGVVLIASNGRAAWAHNTPTWADVFDTPNGLRVQLREPLDSVCAQDTIHMIGCLRDMASDCTNIYGRLYRIAREQLRDMGALLIETEVSGGSNRILEPVTKSN